jgi:hypothetical protein
MAGTFATEIDHSTFFNTFFEVGLVRRSSQIKGGSHWPDLNRRWGRANPRFSIEKREE